MEECFVNYGDYVGQGGYYGDDDYVIQCDYGCVLFGFCVVDFFGVYVLCVYFGNLCDGFQYYDDYVIENCVLYFFEEKDCVFGSYYGMGGCFDLVVFDFFCQCLFFLVFVCYLEYWCLVQWWGIGRGCWIVCSFFLLE